MAHAKDRKADLGVIQHVLKGIIHTLKATQAMGGRLRSYFYPSLMPLHHSQEIMLATAETIIKALRTFNHKHILPMLYRALKALLQRSELAPGQLGHEGWKGGLPGASSSYFRVLTEGLTLALGAFASSHPVPERLDCAYRLLTLGYYSFPTVRCL